MPSLIALPSLCECVQVPSDPSNWQTFSRRSNVGIPSFFSNLTFNLFLHSPPSFLALNCHYFSFPNYYSQPPLVVSCFWVQIGFLPLKKQKWKYKKLSTSKHKIVFANATSSKNENNKFICTQATHFSHKKHKWIWPNPFHEALSWLDYHF